MVKRKFSTKRRGSRYPMSRYKRRRTFYRGPLTPRRSTLRSRIDNRVNIHRFVRWTLPVTNSFTTSTSESAFVWNFESMINYSDFTSLYDRYRIDYVQVRAQLVNTPSGTWALNGVSSSAGNTANYYPKLWWCPDYDDTAQETLDDLKQRAKTKCVVLQPNKVYTFGVKPAILAQTYRTAVTTGYSPKWKQWVDMAQTNVPHYGIKYVLDALNLDPVDTQPFKVIFDFKIFFTCKDVR